MIIHKVVDYDQLEAQYRFLLSLSNIKSNMTEHEIACQQGLESMLEDMLGIFDDGNMLRLSRGALSPEAPDWKKLGGSE